MRTNHPFGLVPRPPRFSVQVMLKNSPGIIRNLSARGALIENLNASLPSLAQCFEVEFAFPGQRTHYIVSARIVRRDSQTGSAALQFLSFQEGSEEDLLNDLIYWGELSRSTGELFSVTPPPGCHSMNRQAELMPFFCTFDDREIDRALDGFMRHILPEGR